MGFIKVTQKPKFNKTLRYLKNMEEIAKNVDFDMIGRMGVDILKSNTPVYTGRLKRSWSYEIRKKGLYATEVVWTNDDIEQDGNVALLLAYDHVTRSGKIIPANPYLDISADMILKGLEQAGWKEV